MGHSSRQIFKWHQLAQPEALTDIQRAARFYYLQQHAFGRKVSGQIRYSDNWLPDQPMPDRRKPECGPSPAGWHLCGESVLVGLHEAL